MMKKPAKLAFLVMSGCALVPAQPVHPGVGGADAVDTLLRGGPLARIGAPAAEKSDSPRSAAWQEERRSFDETLSAVKAGWVGRVSPSPSGVRLDFERYERLVSAETAAGGYGNLMLAWCVRTITNTMLRQHLGKYPSDWTLARELLNPPRTPLISCSATTAMIENELHMAPPAGGWRLIEDQKQIFEVFRADGHVEVGGAWWFLPPKMTEMLGRRDVSGLVMNMMFADAGDFEVLAGLVEYLSRGGSLDDFPIQGNPKFRQLMGDSDR